MRRLNRHNSRMIRFRQWSRKAYAVFSSLGKHVTIGFVGKGIVDASLCKSSHSNAACSEGYEFCTSRLLADDSSDESSIGGNIMPSCRDLMFLLSVENSCSPARKCDLFVKRSITGKQYQKISGIF